MRFECSVCCETIKINQVDASNICSIKCGHVFHITCLKEWIKRSKTCPQCRTPASLSHLHTLFFTVASNDNSISYHNDSVAFFDKEEIRVLKETLEEKDHIIDTIRSLNMDLLKTNTDLEVLLKENNAKTTALEDKVKELETLTKTKDQQNQTLHQKYMAAVSKEFSGSELNIFNRIKMEATGRASLLSPANNLIGRSPAKKPTSIRPKVDTGLTEKQRIRAGIIPGPKK